MVSKHGDPDLRQDMELVFRLYRELVFEADKFLQHRELGRLHYQLLLYLRQCPNEPVSHHLSVMKLTKQSMSRLVRVLLDQGLVEERSGMRDQHERLLLLTEQGAALEEQITSAQSKRLLQLYGKAYPVMPNVLTTKLDEALGIRESGEDRAFPEEGKET